MISRALAIQLEQAGFPAPDGNWALSMYESTSEGFTARPNLSELIEACGDGFGSLEALHDGNDHVQKWRSRSWDTGLETNHWICSTPEEAVAALYLALHKK